MSIDALRTPDERFSNLPDFPWAPRYDDALVGYEGLRMAYLDEGPVDGETFLCLHGEPTWSFLYRKMIPVFLRAGGRIVAPDLFGFGRSDKPRDDATHTWTFHRTSLVALIEKLDLKRITLVCQDWGGLLGLTLPMQMPARFDRLLVMNTALAVGISPGKGFEDWKAFVAAHRDFDVGGLMRRTIPGATDDVVAAYDAPFPDVDHKAGVRAFPQIVPVSRDMEGAGTSREAATYLSERWSGPSFMAIGAQDPVLGRAVMEHLRQVIRGCPEPLVLEDAGHFVQEWGDIVAEAALGAWGHKGGST
jgi:pimeloyl-ACP methyl ester carboxylesterase